MGKNMVSNFFLLKILATVITLHFFMLCITVELVLIRLTALKEAAQLINLITNL